MHVRVVERLLHNSVRCEFNIFRQPTTKFDLRTHNEWRGGARPPVSEVLKRGPKPKLVQRGWAEASGKRPKVGAYVLKRTLHVWGAGPSQPRKLLERTIVYLT
jgi:hypothetical protein